MRQADHRPVDNQGRDHQRHQQAEGGFRRQVVYQYAQRGHQGRDEDGIHRHAAFVSTLSSAFGALPCWGKAEYSTRLLQYTQLVINRQRCRQHHHVQSVCHQRIAKLMENQDEWAGVRGHAGPRQQGEQHRQRANIEDQDTVDNLVGGFRNALLRIIRFRRGDPHSAQTAGRRIMMIAIIITSPVKPCGRKPP